MFVRVELIVDKSEKALVIPEEAVVRRGDKQIVYKVVDGDAVIAPVTLGLRQTGRVEVVEGLQSGDIIVTAGHAKLRDGSKVTISQPAATKG